MANHARAKHNTKPAKSKKTIIKAEEDIHDEKSKTREYLMMFTKLLE